MNSKDNGDESDTWEVGYYLIPTTNTDLRLRN